MSTAIHGFKDRVRFTVHELDLPGFARPDADALSLPDPRYLEIHAACCKVAHVSGAAEFLDRAVRDVEESPGTLAEDGGSAHALAWAISQIVPPA